jgi:hypothetical protein
VKVRRVTEKRLKVKASTVAMRLTLTALPITPVRRFWLLGPVGIVTSIFNWS